MVLGVDLKDAREEMFVRMVCDGLAIGVAFVRAGFQSANQNAASNLWALPRIQKRAQAVLEARRTTGVVTLGEVTDMLQRVFAGAHSEGEYSAAHNAAFSLARLYGHVTDRATLEVIRRPSRDPDAPSEQALGDWVASLPALPGPRPEALALSPEPLPEQGPEPLPEGWPASEGPLQRAPATPLGPGPEASAQYANDINWLRINAPSGPEPSGPEIFNDIKGLGHTPGRPENGAPVAAVTGTPYERGRSEPLGITPPGGSEKGAPVAERQVPVPENGDIFRYPSAEELF